MYLSLKVLGVCEELLERIKHDFLEVMEAELREDTEPTPNPSTGEVDNSKALVLVPKGRRQRVRPDINVNSSEAPIIMCSSAGENEASSNNNTSAKNSTKHAVSQSNTDNQSITDVIGQSNNQSHSEVSNTSQSVAAACDQSGVTEEGGHRL